MEPIGTDPDADLHRSHARGDGGTTNVPMPVDLRARRLEQGLTMQQLAELCTAAGIRVSASEISRIERRIHIPRPALRKKLAELLDVTVAEICRPPLYGSSPAGTGMGPACTPTCQMRCRCGG